MDDLVKTRKADPVVDWNVLDIVVKLTTSMECCSQAKNNILKLILYKSQI
jgi:hypothetical protein